MRASVVRVLVGSLVLLAGFSVLSCADDPNAPGEPIPTSLVVISGSGQSGAVGSELAQPLIVEVRDGSNNPLPGVLVNFVVVKGAGTVFAGAAETDNNGRAQDYWTLGTSTADSQKVEVRSVSGSSGAKELHGTFVATPLPGPVASVRVARDTIRLNWIGDTASAGAAAYDQYGNVVTGATIRWTAGSAGVVALDSLTGVATALELGNRRLIASSGIRRDTALAMVAPVVANLEPTVDSLLFNALQQTFQPAFAAYDSGGTALAGTAVVWRSLNPGLVAMIDSTTGQSQTLAVGVARLQMRSVATGVMDTLRVRIRQVPDSVAVSPPTNILPIGDTIFLTVTAYDSNAVAMTAAQFTWSSSDSSRVRVNSAGRAIGIGYGAVTVTATTASGVPGSAAVLVRNADTLAIEIVSGSGQAGVVGTLLPAPLVARVRNQFGEPVPDIPVVWWSPQASVVIPTAPVSDSDGIVTALVTVDTVARISHALATIGRDTVDYSLVARPGPAMRFIRASSESQSDTVGDVVQQLPRVRALDEYGNGVPGLRVQFTPVSGSTATGTTRTTGIDGRALVEQWMLDTIPGQDTIFAVLVDTLDRGFARLRFVASAVADSGSLQRSLLFAADTVRERDSTIVEVQLRDRFDNPLIKGDGTVTFTAGFGFFQPVVNTNDGWYRAAFRPNGARGTTNILAQLDGDSIWGIQPIISRSYRLRWLGGSTDYNTAGNWGAPGGPPSTLDSLYIPAGLPNYPLLVQNTTVENVFIEVGGTLNVGSFDLTVTRSFSTNSTIGGVGLSGTGRLLMTGIGTLNGDVRYLRVTDTGRSTLDGNLNVTGGRIVVQGGRLRNTSYRIRVRPN